MQAAKLVRDTKKSWIREKIHCGYTYTDIAILACNLMNDWTGETCMEVAQLYNEIMNYREGR